MEKIEYCSKCGEKKVKVYLESFDRTTGERRYELNCPSNEQKILSDSYYCMNWHKKRQKEYPDLCYCGSSKGRTSWNSVFGNLFVRTCRNCGKRIRFEAAYTYMGY